MSASGTPLGIRTLLIDLDGTLVHSEGVAARALVAVFRRHGLALGASDAEAVVGRTWSSAFEILSSRLAFPVPAKQLLEETLEEYRERLRTDVEEVPGAAAAVRALSAHYRLVVVSGSYRAEIEASLELLGVRKHFEFFLGAEDYPRSKPSPDGYQMALARMGLGPAEAVVFEDSEAGIQSGLAAGACVVSITHCSSLPAGSPWLGRSHAQIEDWRGVTADWVQRLGVLHGQSQKA